MELRHLRYFVAVAEELNFSRAVAHSTQAQRKDESRFLPLDRAEVGH